MIAGGFVRGIDKVEKDQTECLLVEGGGGRGQEAGGCDQTKTVLDVSGDSETLELEDDDAR